MFEFLKVIVIGALMGSLIVSIIAGIQASVDREFGQYDNPYWRPFAWLYDLIFDWRESEEPTTAKKNEARRKARLND